MPINRAVFNDLVKNARYQWANARKEFNSVRSMLAVIKQVSEAKSDYSSVSEVETARRRTEGDDAWKGTLKQGYTKSFNQAEIALQVDVTKQMRMFDKYDEIMKKMRGMGRGSERRMELDIASLLSNAWSTTYTNLDGETVTTAAPDGVALIGTHTCNGSSDTFSNSISTTHSPISQAVLESLEEVFNGFLDDTNGRAISVVPDTIVTGRHAPTVHAIKRILNSEFYTENSNNSSNSFKGSYSHLVVPFLDYNPQTEARDSDKARYCFLAALKDKDANGLCLEVSQDIRLDAPEQVLESGTWQFLTTALYDFGVLRANFIAGTKGDGSSV